MEQQGKRRGGASPFSAAPTSSFLTSPASPRTIAASARGISAYINHGSPRYCDALRLTPSLLEPRRGADNGAADHPRAARTNSQTTLGRLHHFRFQKLSVVLTEREYALLSIGRLPETQRLQIREGGFK